MKNVVFVWEKTGSRGGGWWRLHLSCGHTTRRRQPTSLADKRSMIPKKAKCRSCER
jgi:hypothetical protein